MSRLAKIGGWVVALAVVVVACGPTPEPASQPQTQTEKTPSTIAQVIEVERPTGRPVECVVVNQPHGVAVDCDW